MCILLENGDGKPLELPVSWGSSFPLPYEFENISEVKFLAILSPFTLTFLYFLSYVMKIFLLPLLSDQFI